jgi:integrase
VSRRIKYFGGQHQTLPIKETRVLDNFMYYLLQKRERARTDIKRYQADRNWCLCLVGFNTAFRAEDLLQLRVKDLSDGYIHIKENKTGKMQNFKMNKKLHQDILDYVKRNNLTEFDYMFLGQKKIQDGKKYIYPITRQQAHHIVSRTAKDVGINFTFGLHSLRKTFGYMYIKSGGKVLTLMKMYNHDSPDVTLLYICWGREDAEHDREAVYLGGVHK